MKQLRKLFRLAHRNLISANSYALESGVRSVDDYLNRNKDSFAYTKDLQINAKKLEILKV